MDAPASRGDEMRSLRDIVFVVLGSVKGKKKFDKGKSRNPTTNEGLPSLLSTNEEEENWAGSSRHEGVLLSDTDRSRHS
jgi:hypothetical protein